MGLTTVLDGPGLSDISQQASISLGHLSSTVVDNEISRIPDLTVALEWLADSSTPI